MTADVFAEINNLAILEALDAFNIPYQKSGTGYVIANGDWSRDESFSISVQKNIIKDFWKTDIEGWVFDAIGQLALWFSKEEMSGNTARAETLKAFAAKWLVKLPDVKKEFKRSMKKDEIFENFKDLKLWGYKEDIWRWLLTRWFTYEWIQKNNLTIGEAFKDVGFYDSYFCSEYELKYDDNWRVINDPSNPWSQHPVLLFPCYDEEGNLIGMKIRRVDGKTIFGKKSYWFGKTWLIYGNVNKDTSYICEWEADWIVLQLLWFKNSIGNLWWAHAHKEKIKSLLFESAKVICLYDDDDAGQTAKASLWEVMKRVIFQVDMPIRQDVNGRKLSDVNDLYKAWYDTHAKWKKVFDTAYEVWGTSEQNKVNGQRYVFLDKYLEFYDTRFDRKQETWAIASSMGLTTKELNKMVQDNIILKYEDLCYWYWGKEGHYNTLDESSIILHWWDEPPVLHPSIEKLINNIGGWKVKNTTWLHKSILYKLTHINDVNVPAVILYGAWGSGKGTFINLLSAIFWQENTQIGLGQKDLKSSFDSYEWQKLIVEFKEISSGNTHQDKEILDRIKGIIGEPRITVNSKHQKVKEVDNIAWFHLSSNHPVPIQLDSKHSGNRRFTVIKTWNELNKKMARELNQDIITNEKIIKQYISWLFHEYPEVPKLEYFPDLKNEEKAMLEENCEGVGNQFFEWVEQEYPNVYKIHNKQKKVLLEIYRSDTWDDSYGDKRFTDKNFDNSLSHRYEKKPIKIWWKSCRGYYIRKDKAQKIVMPEGCTGEFSSEEWEKVMHRRDNLNFNNF